MSGQRPNEVHVEVTVVDKVKYDFYDLPGETTVFQIKQKINNIWEEIPIERQRLSVGGVEIEDDRTVSSFGSFVKFDLQEADLFRISLKCNKPIREVPPIVYVSGLTKVAKVRNKIKVEWNIPSVDSIALVHNNIVMMDSETLSRYNVRSGSEIQVGLVDEGASPSGSK